MMLDLWKWTTIAATVLLASVTIPAAQAQTTKSEDVGKLILSAKPYKISGVFLTDLRSRGGRAYPRTASPIARKYPGADLLITVVADGKVILPPRPVKLELLPEDQTPVGSYLEILDFAPDGTQLSGVLCYGDFLNAAYKSRMDLCVLNVPGRPMRRFTRNTFISPFMQYPSWRWSPNQRQIAAVEVLDATPLWHEVDQVRLVVFDIATGNRCTVSFRHAKTEGMFKSFYWAKSEQGEPGILYQVQGVVTEAGEREKDSWFFAPVSESLTTTDSTPRPVSENDLSQYGVRWFPAPVIETQKKLSYELRSYYGNRIAPHNTFALFNRDDSIPVGGGEYEMDGTTYMAAPHYYIPAGRTAVVSAAGKVLVNRDDKNFGNIYAWTWDERVLTYRYSDEVPERKFLALRPDTGIAQKAVVPNEVPYPYQWKQLSPTQARHAAKFWRQRTKK